jgi:hypothetical protein
MPGWSEAPGHKKRISETKGGRKAEESDREQEDLSEGEGLHANQNHISYGFYSNGHAKSFVFEIRPSPFRHRLDGWIQRFATRRKKDSVRSRSAVAAAILRSPIRISANL